MDNEIGDQLPRFAKLHWTKAEGSIGMECLLEYSTAQSPLFTIRRKSEVEVVTAKRISVSDFVYGDSDVRLTEQRVMWWKDDRNTLRIVYQATPM